MGKQPGGTAAEELSRARRGLGMVDWACGDGEQARNSRDAKTSVGQRGVTVLAVRAGSQPLPWSLWFSIGLLWFSSLNTATMEHNAVRKKKKRGLQLEGDHKWPQSLPKCHKTIITHPPKSIAKLSSFILSKASLKSHPRGLKCCCPPIATNLNISPPIPTQILSNWTQSKGQNVKEDAHIKFHFFSLPSDPP